MARSTSTASSHGDVIFAAVVSRLPVELRTAIMAWSTWSCCVTTSGARWKISASLNVRHSLQTLAVAPVVRTTPQVTPWMVVLLGLRMFLVSYLLSSLSSPSSMRDRHASEVSSTGPTLPRSESETQRWGIAFGVVQRWSESDQRDGRCWRRPQRSGRRERRFRT